MVTGHESKVAYLNYCKARQGGWIFFLIKHLMRRCTLTIFMGFNFYSDIQFVFYLMLVIWQFYCFVEKKNSRHTPVRWTAIYRFTPAPYRQNEYYDNAMLYTDILYMDKDRHKFIRCIYYITIYEFVYLSV